MSKLDLSFLRATLELVPSSSGSTDSYGIEEEVVVKARFTNTGTESVFFLRWGTPLGPTDTLHKFVLQSPFPMPMVSISRTPIQDDELEAIAPGETIELVSTFRKFRRAGGYGIAAEPISIYASQSRKTLIGSAPFQPGSFKFNVK